MRSIAQEMALLLQEPELPSPKLEAMEALHSAAQLSEQLELDKFASVITVVMDSLSHKMDR